MSIHSTTGTAIYIPVCSSNHCCSGVQKPHHLTLANLDTTDRKIVELTMKRIKKCIRTNHFLTDTPKGKIVSYQIGGSGPNSTFLTGDVESFKQSLDVYLRLDPVVAKHLNPYRPAHVDRYNRPVMYYKNFKVENLKTM